MGEWYDFEGVEELFVYLSTFLNRKIHKFYIHVKFEFEKSSNFSEKSLPNIFNIEYLFFFEFKEDRIF